MYRQYNYDEYHAWYLKNTEIQLKRVKTRLERIKNWYKSYKIGRKCKICKIIADEKHLKQFHFHHKNPDTKLNDITDMVHSGYSIENIKKEMKKCVFLCSSCHAAIT